MKDDQIWSALLINLDPTRIRALILNEMIVDIKKP